MDICRNLGRFADIFSAHKQPLAAKVSNFKPDMPGMRVVKRLPACVCPKKKFKCFSDYEPYHRHGRLFSFFVLCPKHLSLRRRSQPLCRIIERVIYIKLSKARNVGRSMSMKKIDLEAMSVDDLWSLHEQLAGFCPQGLRRKSVN